MPPADRSRRPEATARQRDAPSGAKGVCGRDFMPRTRRSMFDSLSERLGGILDRLTRRGALTEEDVDAALREVRRALLEADVALDVARAFIDKVKEQRRRRRGHQIGDAGPDGREDRARRADRDARRARRADRPQCPGAGADHDGRPAGLRQDHHHRQARQAPHRAGAPQGADGLARHAPPRGDGAARRARPAGRCRHLADRRRPAARADRAARAAGRPARRL